MTGNPISLEMALVQTFRAAFADTITVEAELGRALAMAEYPAAILQYDSGDIRPRVAGQDARRAVNAGSKHVHRYFLDLYSSGQSLERLSDMYETALTVASLFNAANQNMLMVFEGSEGISRSEDMTQDIRSVRLRFRVESE